LRKVLPTQNLGDVLDKLTILTRKLYFGMEDAVSEHRYLEQSLAAWGINGKLITNTIRLGMMNTEIWNLEHEMRKDGREEHELSQAELAEDGRRARRIRDINRKRIDYKNKITQLYGKGIGFQECKVNHRSQ
jgi:hypothetical protein